MDELKNLKVKHIKGSKSFEFTTPSVDIYDEEIMRQQLEKFLSLEKKDVEDNSDK